MINSLSFIIICLTIYLLQSFILWDWCWMDFDTKSGRLEMLYYFIAIPLISIMIPKVIKFFRAR